MAQHFADRLTEAIRQKGTPACVGIDPVFERLPAEITSRAGLGDARDSEAALDAILEYCRRVIQVVAPLVPVVKINIAFFERYWSDGVEGYFDLVQEAKGHGLIVIGDVKRSDIGHSSAMYAGAQLGDPPFDNLAGMVGPDAVTVNAYLGSDGVAPFVELARSQGKGVFVLVHTSNPSASEVQHLRTEQGCTVAEHVARLVDEWARADGMIGANGYSSVGAVVAPADPEMASRLREAMPNSVFLVPGFGAQARSIEQVSACFKSDGSGAIVNASRSVLYAYQDAKYSERFGDDAWESCVAEACKDFVTALASVGASCQESL